jgi:pentatricopeptide repeat protein
MNAAARETSINDYAAIGDCRTLALVSCFGSIDWCCLPDFSSPSLFAALVDRERGGCFALTPREIVQASQHYAASTNVLRTRIECRGGVVEITDFMTLPEASGEGPQRIVRLLECVEGAVEIDARFEPRPDYARAVPHIEQRGELYWTGGPPAGAFDLCTTFPLQGGGASLQGVIAMERGHVHAAVLGSPASAAQRDGWAARVARQHHAATVAWWRSWCEGCAFEGEHAQAVRRSALALKLLTHQRTGALVAAGTTSLPENETGARNWDYRFCWLRDSSLVFAAFTGLGYTRESGAFLKWLLHATHRTRPRLQIVYDVYGGHRLEEHVLPNLRGYDGIGPVRIGNAASHQMQNDVYGEVIVTACDYVMHGGQLEAAEREFVARFTQMACQVWREPDHGIWEIRTAPRHNTHSKLMCWAALDRALRIHGVQPLPIDVAQVERERDAIRADIEAHGWNAALGSYVGYYGSEAPDASLLLIPRMGYIAANDARMLGTTQRILRELSAEGLLYRYPPDTGYDGLPGGEHLFAICSFWCVDCLARQGRIDKAHQLYERLLSLRSPAGLYAEEFDVRSGRPIGNFPQAFSHVGSITAALSLRAAREAHK